MSQFLSTLERWLDMPSYLETRFHMSVNKNWLYIPITVSSNCFKGFWAYSKHFLLLEQILKKSLSNKIKPENFTNKNLKFLKYSKTWFLNFKKIKALEDEMEKKNDIK